MPNRSALVLLCILMITALHTPAHSQGVLPYPHAITDRSIHDETTLLPPAKYQLFRDPDFGSLMERVTDRTTNFKLPGTYIRTEASGKANEWSSDTSKFYVIGKGGQVLAFGFNPKTMAVASLPNATAGNALLVPLRPGPTFSFVDPDLIYGTRFADPLSITTYRFSTNSVTTVLDTRNCGVQPPLGSGPSVVSDDDVSLSFNDKRISISEGGASSGEHMFVIVYDKSLGCRWYNTETGQIGGQWGTKGNASVSVPYLVRHAYLSKNGQYAMIMENNFGWYLWNLSTLQVTPCPVRSPMECAGYGVLGFNSYVNGPAAFDDMQILKRPLKNVASFSNLYYPIPSPSNWGQQLHFTWSNVNTLDNTPVCGSSYGYDTDTDQPYAGEIFCVETDGLASTVWRFAHNRALYVEPYFQTQPIGNVSRDGRFYLFTSDWDGQLGPSVDGTPDSAVFIVKLE